MANICVRNLDPVTLKNIKQAARKHSLSMNRYIVETLEKSVNPNPSERHDLDEFFGSWSKDEHARMTKALKAQRTIDKELWK